MIWFRKRPRSRAERALDRVRSVADVERIDPRRGGTSRSAEYLGLSFVSGLGLGFAIGWLIAVIMLARREDPPSAQVGPTRIQLLPRQPQRLGQRPVTFGAS